MPTVLDFYVLGKTVPPGAVYIGRGRGSIRGDPFSIGKDGDRDDVIRKHRERLLARPELIALARVELAGTDLVSFCAPAPATATPLPASPTPVPAPVPG